MALGVNSITIGSPQMRSSNQKVNEFLSDIQNTFPDSYKTIQEIRKLFFEENSDLSEEIKYGGITFNVLDDLVAGIYLYKKHISIEFSHGSSFQDPEKQLEGKGKMRRHLKIIDNEDINNKSCRFYIKQAVG